MTGGTPQACRRPHGPRRVGGKLAKAHLYRASARGSVTPITGLRVSPNEKSPAPKCGASRHTLCARKECLAQSVSSLAQVRAPGERCRARHIAANTAKLADLAARAAVGQAGRDEVAAAQSRCPRLMSACAPTADVSLQRGR